jgi:GlcNAc-PI de-N-acetylase
VSLLYGIGNWIMLALVAQIAWGDREIRATSSVKHISNPPKAVDVVLVAHQDDWQLFMGDIVARQIQAGKQVVFIYLTAGDDGRDSLYWVTRERGALESTRIAAGSAAGNSDTDRCSSSKALEHTIRRCTIANTDSYFLRLPDGRRNGTGFARYGHESLRKLRRERIASISAVDGSTIYDSWADLMSTVNELIGESSADRIVTIHTSDPSVAANPHDHFDHRMAGLLVADSRRRNRWSVVYYSGYALATRAPNRSNSQVREKTALFLAYDRVMTQANAKWSAYRERPAFYSQCMLRTYARRIAFR